MANTDWPCNYLADLEYCSESKQQKLSHLFLELQIKILSPQIYAYMKLLPQLEPSSVCVN